MKNALILARCNLFGVMRNLEVLGSLDQGFQDLARRREMTVQFIVKGGPLGHLSFNGGTVVMKEGRGRSRIILSFTSPDHFNRMVEGKANPLPLKGFTRLKFLTGPFTEMTGLLEKYLRPDEEALKDPVKFKASTILTAYTAFFSLVEIANHDPVGRACARAIPDGTIQIGINGGPGIQIHAQGGTLRAERGYAAKPRAILSFRDLTSAHAVLNGCADTFTALALGDMEMRGFIPMIEHMNPILEMVSLYLK